MNNSTLERLTNPEERAKADRQERQARINGIILRAILVILSAFWLLGVYRMITGEYVRITNVEAIGTTELCPGDELLYRYEYQAKGKGRFIIDATVWRVDPPQTIVFSDSLFFVLVGERHESVTSRWLVPSDYMDLATGQATPLPPGNYERQFAITSSNNDEVDDTGVVPFVIRNDCPK